MYSAKINIFQIKYVVYRFNNLSIFMKDFQQEIDKIEAQNTISTEMEIEVAREFKECKSDMV